MTNKEFYGDKLLAIILEDNCHKLHKAVHGERCIVEKDCKGCEFYTVESIENWLNAEHEEPEPPLLENGDDLKPGDWIMVRDNDKDDWEKKVFIGYLKGYFYCASELFGALEADAASYSQARLPEDGE